MNQLVLHTFDVKLDKIAKVFTVIHLFIFSFFLFVLANLVILYDYEEMLPEKEGLAVICFALIAHYAFSPRKLILTDKELIVKCRAYSKHIPIRDIVSCTFPSEIMDSFSIRLLASMGLGGYYGLFWNSKYGVFKAFFGKRSSTFTLNLVSGKIVVLGCENSQLLVKELTSAVNKSQS